jgi:hypothetical protein
LEFDHPATGRRMVWTSPLPEDLARLLRHPRKKEPRTWKEPRTE